MILVWKDQPGFYRWEFSDDYPAFPEGGLSNWTHRALMDCTVALQRGQIQVVKLLGEDGSQPRAPSPVRESQQTPTNNARDAQREAFKEKLVDHIGRCSPPMIQQRVTRV